MKIEIYTVYNKDEQVEQNHLLSLDPNIYTLYNTNETHKNSLDVIQLFINEFTCQYYVWKNNLYSDYVGFCHYRRVLKFPSFDFLNSNNDWYGISGKIPDSFKAFQEIRFNNFLTDDLNDYIKKNYKETDNPYKYFITNRDEQLYYIANELYIAKWNLFVEMTSFIGGFIEYIDKKYALKFDPENYFNFIQVNFVYPKMIKGFAPTDTWLLENNGRNMYRVMSNYIEILIGFYLANTPT